MFSLSHEQNKARFNYAVARKQRRSQFKRNLNGYFGVARAQEILEEIFVEGLLRKKSLEEIFNKIWPVARNNLSLK